MKSTKDAFTLTEVVLALGIASFALIGMIGLLPVGFKAVAETDNDSRVVSLLSSIITDRRASPFASPSTRYNFPSLKTPSSPSSHFDVAEDGSLVGGGSSARFRVHYLITPPASNSLEPYRVWLRVTQPAAGANQPTLFETIATFSPQ